MFLYDLIITPIKMVLEVCYYLFSEITNSQGLSVIGLSFVVTLCCLPLYIVAESWQEKERQLQATMKDGVQRIKQAFKGDEQYMMLTTYYRQHHYHPIMALRSSFGLLIQIPFFIAAYSFLSHLETLKGVPFLFITDMGNPDALFHIGSFPVNVLPIAMTLINLVSGALYSKGHGIQEKVQIYVSALVFLLLLYQSPAGLVLYWTMNNILSLVKNIFYKLRHPLKVLYLLAAGLSVLGMVAALLTNLKAEFKLIVAFVCVLIIASPLIVRATDFVLSRFFRSLDTHTRTRNGIFVLSALIIAVLAGLVVPSMLIQSEPEEFCYVDSYTTPFIFLHSSLWKGMGLFFFWPFCFYALFSKKIKKLFAVCAPCLALYTLANSFIFSGNYGPLTQQILFMEAQRFGVPAAQVLLNAIVLAGIVAAVVVLLQKRLSPLVPALGILLVGMGVICATNVVSVRNAFSRMTPPVVKDTVEPIFHLSKTHPNVLVFMQDRFFMPFVDEVFLEDDSLAAHWDGFVFYPNTVSMGHLTMLGTPGLFGGYDYTIFEMNRHQEKTLREKHNEAILTMPVLFSEQGFSATVCDMPYENYLKQPVEDMYKDFPAINREITVYTYADYWYKTHNLEKLPFISFLMKRNLVYFGIFKAFPPVLRRVVYHKEYWNTSEAMDHFTRFVANYSVIDLLPELTDTAADDTDWGGVFILMDNEATHEQMFLQAPDYVPSYKVTNYGNAKWKDSEQYHAQAGITRLYGKFFDYLKAQGVYDNTRIIIVSDHGAPIDTGLFAESEGVDIQKERVVAALLVKDFNAHTPEAVLQTGLLQKDMRFMTNADTPSLAVKDLIPNAKHPFTHRPLAPEDKSAWVKIAIPRAQSTRARDDRQFAISPDAWYTVHDDIFTRENWSKLPRQNYED